MEVSMPGAGLFHLWVDNQKVVFVSNGDFCIFRIKLISYMRYLLTTTLLLIINSVFCQNNDSLLTYTEVISVEGHTKDQLFGKARQWFNDAWKSSKDVLQITDKESGELSGKGIVSSYYDNKGLGMSTRVPVEYKLTVSIFVKDGRYKYEFTSFQPIEGKSGMEAIGTMTSSTTCPVKFMFASQKKSDAIYQNLKMHLDERMAEMIAGLKRAMTESKSKTDF
jgi:hypothetical protein